MMRNFFTVLFAAFLLSAPAQAYETPKAQLMAVYAYADWCPNCKALAPTLQSVRTQMEGKEVLFVTLDLTDKPKTKHSVLLANALGIGEWLKKQGAATGYLALLDANTKKELARFDRDTPEETMVGTINKNLKL